MTVSTQRNTQSNLDIPHHGTLNLTRCAAGNRWTEVTRSLESLHMGQILRVTGDLSVQESDLYAWADHTNNQILAIDQTPDRGLGYYLLKGDPWPVDVPLDTRTAPGPTPVVMCARSLAVLRSGQTLRLSTSHRAAVSEVDAWLRYTRHRLLGITEDARGVYRFYIRKT